MRIFDYVMMLTAIVIGLAMTHLMQGVGRIVEDPRGSRIWWVHLVWVAHMATLAVFWWWFEYSLRLIAAWTFQLYAFVLGYAFLIYLICTILFPSNLGKHIGYKEYFISRRRWFFGLLAAEPSSVAPRAQPASVQATATVNRDFTRIGQASRDQESER